MASFVQHVVAPHSAHKEQQYIEGASGARGGTYTPDSMPAGARRIVATVRDLFRARFMEDYCRVLPALSRDVVWDAPPILTSRKGHLRVASYLAKFAATLDLEPALVTVKDLGGGRNLVDITGTVRVYPRRSWLLLPTLLLPASIPIRTSIKVGVKGDLQNGQIELIYGSWHNLPSLPSPLRNLSGLFLGGVPHLAEPVWSRAMEFVGDDFYKRKRERSIADGTAGPVDTAIDLSSHAINGVGDLASSIFFTLLDTANKAREAALHYADTTYTAVRDTAASAADAVTDTARGAADKVADTAHGAYENVVPSDVKATARKDMSAGAKAAESGDKAGQRARAAAGLDPAGAGVTAR